MSFSKKVFKFCKNLSFLIWNFYQNNMPTIQCYNQPGVENQMNHNWPGNDGSLQAMDHHKSNKAHLISSQ